jgi:hypothetical protein
MFDELLPASLSTGAKRLGVEPLEIVRLMVQSDTVTPDLTVTSSHLAQLAEVGGIESGWWEGVDLPADTHPQRAVVRAAIGLLAERASGPVRMDNLWRGRPLRDQELIEETLNLLDEAGTIQIVNAPQGVQVLVDAAQVDTLKGISAGTTTFAALDELFQS